MGAQIGLHLTPDLQRLLAASDVPRGVTGEVTSNLVYMLALEYGHSKQQAPEGWIRRNRDAYARLLRGEIEHALGVYRDDPVRGVVGGVWMGVLGIAQQIADGTPVDTGRAKGSWVARLPDGKRQRQAPAVSAAQQRAALRRRRKEGRST